MYMKLMVAAARFFQLFTIGFFPPVSRGRFRPCHTVTQNLLSETCVAAKWEPGLLVKTAHLLRSILLRDGATNQHTKTKDLIGRQRTRHRCNGHNRVLMPKKRIKTHVWKSHPGRIFDKWDNNIRFVWRLSLVFGNQKHLNEPLFIICVKETRQSHTKML